MLKADTFIAEVDARLEELGHPGAQAAWLALQIDHMHSRARSMTFGEALDFAVCMDALAARKVAAIQQMRAILDSAAERVLH